MTDHPVVRLRPKINPRRIRHGFPWVYANELVVDRRTKNLTPGTLARLEDAERKPLALVTVNPGSKIIARVMDQDPEADVARLWIERRLQAALELRERLFDAPYYRLVHAEADGFPGVIIDRFGDVAVIQPNAAWAEVHVPDLTEAVAAVTGVTTLL